MKCVVCSNRSNRIISNKVRDSSKNKVIQCKKCDHVQISPIPSRADDKVFYDNNLQEKNQSHVTSLQNIKKISLNDTNRRFDFVSKICKKDEKILEIGSGYGFFLEKMKKSGFNVTGIEVSKERRNILKKVTKSKIININLMDENLNIEKFDVIVLFHVLEHISELKIFLKNLRNILKKNGRIIIEVPNYNDFQIELNDEYKKWHFQRAHIHYFTPKTLKNILKKSGFKNINIMGVQRYGIGNMFNWKINKKPQLDNPDFEFGNGYEWIEKNYKKYLQDNLISDTIIAIVY